MGDIEDICQYYIGLGFGGFRCDVAAQIPAFFIRKLIGLVRLEHGKYCILVEILWMTNSKAFILSQYPQALMTEYAGGEPYMYPEIVAGILQTFPEYWMRITTNGLLLTEYDIHLLKTHGKACLGISLEYFCSYSHAANAAYEMHEFERLTAELSARLWRSYNGPVYMMTDEAGWQYIRKSGLENVYDGVFPVLEWRNYGINTYKYWASGKIQALMRIQAPCALIFGGFFT